MKREWEQEKIRRRTSYFFIPLCRAKDSDRTGLFTEICPFDRASPRIIYVSRIRGKEKNGASARMGLLMHE